MNNFLKAFLVVFFLCGFPLIFIGITLHYVLDLEQKKLETALFSRIDLKLAKFQTFSSQETFLRSFLTSFGKRSDKNGLSNDHLIKKIKNVNKEFPLLFSFILFDRSGELIYQDISNNSEWISKKLLFLLRKYYQSGEDHFQGYFPVLSNFIGCSVKRVQRILERPDLIETSSKPQKSWFFYYLGTNFSFFAHIHRVGYPPMMPLRKAIQRPPKDGIIISLVDMGSKQVYSLGDEKVKVLIENVAFRFEQEPRVHLSENGRLWSSIILDSRFRLIASSLDETFKTTGRLKRVFYLSVILVLLFSFWTVLTFLKRTSIPYISLRWKLLVLFLLSSGLPLLILAFTVMVYLDQRTQSLKQDAWVQSGEILRAFDSKFPVALRDCQAALQKILSETNLNLSGGLKNLEARIKEFRTNYKCSTFKLMSNATDSFLLSDARKEAQSGKIFQTIMLNVLRQLNGETEKNSNNMLALETDLFLSSFVGQEMSDLIDNILLSLGTIFKMDLALNSWYVFIDTIKDKNGFSSHIFAVTWDRVDIVGYYLRKCFPFKPLEDGTELFAIDTNPVWVKEMVPGTNSSTFKRRFRCFPRKPVSKSFRRFIQSLLKNRRVSQDLLVYKKVNFLATGVPGKLLENLILVALKPESPIRHEIDFLRSRLLLFGLFSLGFTSFLGIFLAKKFLGPINELANGVVAVKEKKFAFRLPNQDPDELGDLSALFNNMMESLYEVSMGREVQEKLFPKKKLCVGEYQVFGLSKPATELGGDYFDYLPIG
ncbi:HAMP domain-containing protein, partial [bacterium]|nr:HAMP domain-containing protein [bacterium]